MVVHILGQISVLYYMNCCEFNKNECKMLKQPIQWQIIIIITIEFPKKYRKNLCKNKTKINHNKLNNKKNKKINEFKERHVRQTIEDFHFYWWIWQTGILAVQHSNKKKKKEEEEDKKRAKYCHFMQ